MFHFVSCVGKYGEDSYPPMLLLWAPRSTLCSPCSFKFKFDGMFDMAVKQGDIFAKVAQQSVDNVLDGYNATIFAYGQTGE